MATNFFDDATRTPFMTHIFIVALGLISMAYVGVNRLSIIPCIMAFFNGVATILGWYVWTPGPGGESHANTANTFITYTFYVAGEITLPFYGYFLLEKLLPAVGGGGLLSRKAFIYTFWFLQLINCSIRISLTSIAAAQQAKADMGEKVYSNVLSKILYEVTLVAFLVVGTIEIFTAYLLIVLFRRARKTAIRFLGGKRLGLFQHILLSTEIRVASFATIVIIRAGCELPKRNKASMTAVRVDATAIDFMWMMPLLLVTDCIIRKSMATEMKAQYRTETGRAPEATPALSLGILHSIAVPQEKIPGHSTEPLEMIESA